MAEGTTRGRPRLAETDRRIREAARDLLRQRGPGAVNVEAVATRSGVARTTIYRRYRSRRELLETVLDGLLDEGVPPSALPLPDKLGWVLGRVRTVLEDGIGRGGTAAVLADSDAEFSAILRTLLADRRQELTRAMQADLDAGRLAPGVDPDDLAHVLFGAYLAEVLLHPEARTDWTARTVALLAPGLTPRT